MNQNESSQIPEDPSTGGSEAQEDTPKQPGKTIQLSEEMSNALVQCYLIAARRGRQIRLAREQAAQQQQGESGGVSEEAA
ncbi:hypothetical protein PLCT2_00579 [Planctomycetaceae bacterium]|nr:hypothetical protein PLCT2_00579 [Planctomycetaceae bacterium]